MSGADASTAVGLLCDFDETIDIVFDPAGEAGERGNHSFASQSLIKKLRSVGVIDEENKSRDLRRGEY